jgi:hypothetical protein
MKNSSLYQEIFGNDDIEPSAPEPPSPLDDLLWEFRPATEAGDTLYRQLEDADLLSKITGCDDDTATRTITQAPPPAVAAPLSGVLSRLLSRACFVQSSAPARKAAINGIVDRATNNDVFRPIKGDDRWDSLAQSIESYITSAIVAP